MLKTSIAKDLRDPRFIKLYYESFPPQEIIPLPNLFRTLNNGGKLRFFFDNSEFVGFCYTFEYKTSVYFAYLAVCPELRSMGYGSEIIDQVLGEYKHRNVFLTVEKEFGNRDEMRIRHRRREFYRHNGWRDAGIEFISEGIEFNTFYVDSMIHEEDLHENLYYFELAQRGFKI